MTYQERLNHIMRELEELRAGPQNQATIIQQCVLQSEYEVTRCKYVQKVQQNFVNLFKVYLRQGGAGALVYDPHVSGLPPVSRVVNVEVRIDQRDSPEEQIYKIRDACMDVALQVTDGEHTA